MKYRAMLWAALWVATGASAQVYKCPDAGGRVVMQQIPCAGPAAAPRDAGQTQPVPASQKKVMTPSEISKAFDEQVQSPEIQKRLAIGMGTKEAAGWDARARSREVREAAEERCGTGRVVAEPSVGMTENQFLRCTHFARQWDPRRVHETETALGVSKQYAYPPGAPITYVYVHGGKVTTIQR